MRILALAAAAMMASATAALAAPATVQVTVSPDLQGKAVKKYGQRDIDELASALQRNVETQLARTGAYADARIELTLVDAKPNRPTFKQMGDKPGLSYESFSIGGASIQGRAVAADGTVIPLGYKWYESDITQVMPSGTWSDAEWTISRFAWNLARGDALAER
jgi:hypothetical protein